MTEFISDLGPRLTRQQVQAVLGISEDLLLADPVRFGGVWLGPRKLVFFEKLISEAIRNIYASQKDQKEGHNVDRSGKAPEWEADREGILDQGASAGMGIHPEIRALANQIGPDLWPMASQEDQ